MNKFITKCSFIALFSFTCFTSNTVFAQEGIQEVPKAAFHYQQEDTKSLISMPEIEDIQRVAAGERPSREVMKNTVFIKATTPHAVNGSSYVILSDHKNDDYKASLNKLAQHRSGTIIYTEDLANLYKDEKENQRLHGLLLKEDAKYVAIAPRIESYRENMILGVYELLANLDEDTELDVYPGILVASSAKKFDQLVVNTINYKAPKIDEITPVADCMVPGLRELRSLQKNGIIHNYFAQYGLNTPMINLYCSEIDKAPQLTGENSYNIDMKGKKSLKTLPKNAGKAFEDASLIVLHGHGIPGTSCGLDVDIIPEHYNTDMVICGSCFSAAPEVSDLPAMRKSPDGHEMRNRQSFALKAIDNGAIMAYGHMRLNSGFPILFPVLETLVAGRTVGEAYQETINNALISGKFDSKKLAVRATPKNPRRIPQNTLLYVVFGDPALQMIAPSAK